MWYQIILADLISKVRENERDDARIFLNKLCELLEFLSKPTPDKIVKQRPELPCSNAIPAVLLLGLIDKMYQKYGEAENTSVSLVEFTRDLLGLLIGTLGIGYILAAVITCRFFPIQINTNTTNQTDSLVSNIGMFEDKPIN